MDKGPQLVIETSSGSILFPEIKPDPKNKDGGIFLFSKMGSHF